MNSWCGWAHFQTTPTTMRKATFPYITYNYPKNTSISIFLNSRKYEKTNQSWKDCLQQLFLVVTRDSLRGCVCPSVGPSVRPSVRWSVHPSVTRFFWFTENAWNRARSGQRSIRMARRAEIRRRTTYFVYTNLFYSNFDRKVWDKNFFPQTRIFLRDIHMSLLQCLFPYMKKGLKEAMWMAVK